MAVNANEERLPRLLALVPYLQARPGISVAEAAADFGVTEAQLRRDLTLLWMCGLPGHGPGDLIDLSFEGDSVSVVFDAGMSRPLRLTAEEALALVVALRTLAETPGLADTDAVQRALAKVETAAGGAVDDTTVAVELDHDERLLPSCCTGRSRTAGRCGCATTAPRATRPASAPSTRCGSSRSTAAPISRRGAGRPRACACSASTASRTPRCSTSRRTSPADVQLRDLTEGVFQPASEHLLVELRLGPAYAWVADYYSPRTSPKRATCCEVSLRVADPAMGPRAGARLGRPGRGAVARLAGRGASGPRRRAPSPPTPRSRVRGVHWIPIAAWGAAVLLAVVVLGFCAYEINWKAKRLQRDLRRLQGAERPAGRLAGSSSPRRRNASPPPVSASRWSPCAARRRQRTPTGGCRCSIICASCAGG